MVWLMVALASLGGQDPGERWEVVYETTDVWVGYDTSRPYSQGNFRRGWFVVALRAPTGREAYSVVRMVFNCATPQFNVWEKWHHDIDCHMVGYVNSREILPVSPDTPEAAMLARVCVGPQADASTETRTYAFPAVLAEGARAAR